MNKRRQAVRATMLYLATWLIPICFGVAVYLKGSQDPACTGEAARIFFFRCIAWSYPVSFLALGIVPIAITVIYVKYLLDLRRKK